MKTLSRQQLERRKAQAARFARDVREDDDLADAIEDESLEEYAERRRITLLNPKRGNTMPMPSRRELLDKIDELETENEDLQSRLDDISDLVSGEDEEGTSGEGEE